MASPWRWVVLAGFGFNFAVNAAMCAVWKLWSTEIYCIFMIFHEFPIRIYEWKIWVPLRRERRHVRRAEAGLTWRERCRALLGVLHDCTVETASARQRFSLRVLTPGDVRGARQVHELLHRLGAGRARLRDRLERRGVAVRPTPRDAQATNSAYTSVCSFSSMVRSQSYSPLAYLVRNTA